MDTKKAYDSWSGQYDADNNKTRDLEATALRKTLAGINFDTVLEIGCGTGKNTQWLAEKAKQVVGVDLSAAMLAIAKQKVISNNVNFKQADINKNWAFAHGVFNLISFSLVLEHIEKLKHIFKETANKLAQGGYVYIGELHPCKQYKGSKAQFKTEQGQQVVPCFTHNITDFTLAAQQNGLQLVEINEYFDDNNRNYIPRILVLVFKKA